MQNKHPIHIAFFTKNYWDFCLPRKNSFAVDGKDKNQKIFQRYDIRRKNISRVKKGAKDRPSSKLKGF